MTFNRNLVAIDALDSRLRTSASRLLPLAEGYGQRDSQTLKLLFANDAERSAKFSLTVDEIHFDYSKSLIDSKALAALAELAEACGFTAAKKAKNARTKNGVHA